MKVDGPKGPSQVRPRKSVKTGRASASGAFAGELDRLKGGDDAEVDAAGSVDQTSSVAGLGGILAAQSVDPSAGVGDYEERKRRARRGAEILDRLEDIRRGLLVGTIPKDRLAALARLVREKRERGADPVISQLLDEIELRAEVELAKLGRR